MDASERQSGFIHADGSRHCLPPCWASGAFMSRGSVWRPHNLFMFTVASKSMRPLPPKRDKFASHVRPLFSRPRGSSGRWDTVCMKCHRILVADEKSGLPSLKAAHKCNGFSLAALLHTENIRPSATWRFPGALLNNMDL